MFLHHPVWLERVEGINILYGIFHFAASGKVVVKTKMIAGRGTLQLSMGYVPWQGSCMSHIHKDSALSEVGEKEKWIKIYY
jgi:hypothetical protein